MNSGQTYVGKVLTELLHAYRGEVEPNQIEHYYKAHNDIQWVIDTAVLEERQRWITPTQQKVLNEIGCTLSPRLTDLARNTGYSISTIQRALSRLTEVELVKKTGKTYELAPSVKVFA